MGFLILLTALSAQTAWPLLALLCIIPLPGLASSLDPAGCELCYQAPCWSLHWVGKHVRASRAISGTLKVEGRFPAALLLCIGASDRRADSCRFLLFRDALPDQDWRLLQRRLTLEAIER